MKRFSQTLRAGLAIFMAVFSSGLIQLYAAPSASAYTAPTEEPITQVMICHAREGSEPYGPGNEQTVSINSAGELQGGHNTHTGNGQVWSPTNTTNFSDIIPPFYYLDGDGVKQYSGGLGWSTEGQRIYANNCVIVDDEDKTVNPVAPNVTKITTCGTYGSIVFATTAHVTYTLTQGDGKQGSYEVTATADEGYTVAEGAATKFTGDLGNYTSCPRHYLQTSHQKACGQITISLRNVSPWMYRVLIEEKNDNGDWVRVGATTGDTKWQAAPGVMIVNNLGNAPDDQTGTYTVQYDEDAGNGVREVRYKVSSGAEDDLYLNLPVGTFQTVTVYTDCVEPEQLPSEANWLQTACVAGTNTTDLLEIVVINTKDESNLEVTYTVTITPEIGAAITKQVTVADGEESTVVFENLPAGEYVIDISATDETEFESEHVTIDQCTVTPGSGSGNGHTLGGATDVKTPTVLPTTIPATGANGVQNQLVIVLAALTAYGATFFFQNRRKLSANEA